MKTLFLISILVVWACGRAAGVDLVVRFEERDDEVVATCEKSTYVLKEGESNDRFLMDKAVVDGKPQQAGKITAIFSSNLRVTSYFHVKSHLDRLGYAELKVYLVSPDGKNMVPIEIKGTGAHVPLPQKTGP